jgi:8-oxo-dGTP pyrophosphatase MutT (NUDIX family)
MFHLKKRWFHQTIQKYPKVRRAGILLQHGSDYLVIHQKSSGFWGFPKGRLEFKEPPIFAALRELKEETGVQVSIDQVEKVPMIVKLSDLNYFYLVKVNERPEVYVDQLEIDGYKWCSLQDLKLLPTSALTKKLLHGLGV